MRARLLPLVALLLSASCLCACALSDEVKETAENVLTLQSGTVNALRARTGTGPFVTYEVSPERMLGVLDAAARRARACDGSPVVAVFRSDRYREVIAKERAPDASEDEGYSEPFRSAMIAVVTPVEGRPGSSQVEIHAIRRGPFHRGCVEWERDMPGWIRAELRGVGGPAHR